MFASSPDCMYCQETEKLKSLMIFIAELPNSKLYLFRDQTYFGRCLVAYKGHVSELCTLGDADAAAFIKDVCTAARAVSAAFNPQKINYGAYGDKLPHLHFHIVPKYDSGPDFGGTFAMNPEPPHMLSDDEYKALITKIRSALQHA